MCDPEDLRAGEALFAGVVAHVDVLMCGICMRWDLVGLVGEKWLSRE